MFVGLAVSVKDIFVLRYLCSEFLAALVGPVQNTKYNINSFVPLAQQAGQAAVLGRLSLSVCLYSLDKDQDQYL